MKRIIWLISLLALTTLFSGCGDMFKQDNGTEENIQKEQPIVSVDKTTKTFQSVKMENGILLNGDSTRLQFVATLDDTTNCDDSNSDQTDNCTGEINTFSCSMENDYCSAFEAFECSLVSKPVAGSLTTAKTVLNCKATGSDTAEGSGVEMPSDDTVYNISARLYQGTDTLGKAFNSGILFTFDKSGIK